MPGPVVIGVDGTDVALRAVRWAAEQAGRHGTGVRLVHAIEQPDSQDRVARLLHAAERVARATVADLPVTVATGTVLPSELLVCESGDASMVVLGGPGHGGFTGRLLGATTLTVAARGRSPLVVMTGEPGHGPVVVGTDGRPTSDAAVAFACQEAVVRETDLLVVRSWAERATPPRDGRTVTRLADWQARHPEVKVRHEIVPDPPGEALLDRATDAQLVVVGGRRPIGHRAQVLRATGQFLLHHAHCPVAVVRWDHCVDPLWMVTDVAPGEDQ